VSYGAIRRVLTASAVGEIDVIACFVTSTRILTSDGESALEDLRIGDAVQTLHAGLQKIKWIGRRSYVAPFANNEKILPICIRTNAIDVGVPARDLHVSPGHAICVDDALFHAGRLANGVSITQVEAVTAIAYYYIELENHGVIFAEGCAAETFMDENFRAQFQNADECHALYPDGVAAQMLCLPRHDGRLVLGAMQRRLVARARIAAAAGLGALRGYVNGAGPDRCFGWALDEAAPDRAVYLDIFLGVDSVKAWITWSSRAECQRFHRCVAPLERPGGDDGVGYTSAVCSSGVRVRRGAGFSSSGTHWPPRRISLGRNLAL
jgi:hypothetical protein